jgi:hypothetical protein
MLNRLGLVIHWLAVVLTGFWVFIAITVLIFIGTEDMLKAFAGLVVPCLVLLTTGWLINFILTGHKSPLPWVANKEANNG